MRRWGMALGAALTLVAVLAGPASAAPGALDPSFGGGDGQVALKLAQGGATAFATALQSDGKIVTAGNVYLGGGNYAWVLARFRSNGTVDTGFGDQGTVVTDWSPGDDEADSVVILSSGKIVAAGYENGNFAAARYTSEGKLDHTFGGGDGKVKIDFGSDNDRAFALVKAPGGKLVLGGQSVPADHIVISLARLNSDGTLDHAFSGDGKATDDVGTSDARALVAQADGSIVVAATSFATNEQVLITKFDSNGSVDPAFGFWFGHATHFAGATGLVRLPSGKYLLGGDVIVAKMVDDIGVWRFKANGRPDDSFGDQGLVETDFGSSEEPTGLVRSGSKLLLPVRRGVNSSFQMAVARLNADGTPDTTFGPEHGISDAGFPSANGQAVAVQHDGNIVVAGFTSESHDKIAVARFLAS